MKKKKHQDRAYQQEIEDAIFNFLFTEKGNPVAASPGGTGKSYVMAKIIKRFVTEWPGTRVIQLAQDSKLLDQNCNELLHLWPTAPCGIYSAGLDQRDTRSPIIFGGIQSCAKRAAEFGFLDIAIVDECDQVSPKEETLYQMFFNEMKRINPKARIIGLTATPYRLGTGCLTNLDLWDKVVIDLTKTERFNWFVEEAFLKPLVTKKPSMEMDITKIAMKGNDFDEKSMQEVADTDDLNKAVVEECVRYGSDRRHWLVFASGVKHGHKLAKLFNARGVPTVMLSGEDSVAAREEGEAKFRAGEYRCLVNVGLYGRGWNFVDLDLIAWVRATQSCALWVQGCVRGTRISEHSENCLVLDFAGNIRRLGPVNDPVVPAPRRKGDGEKGEAPVKECPECHSYLHTRTMICPDCGYVFPPPKTIKETADTAEILAKSKNVSTEPILDDFRIRSVTYKVALSKKNNIYFKVTYGVGTTKFQECLFFDATNGLAIRRNKNWWLHRGGNLPIPTSAEEAAERAPNELKTPTVVTVDVSKKFPDVCGCSFDPDATLHDDEVEDDDIPF
jgi:DNA repair protein RadD